MSKHTSTPVPRLSRRSSQAGGFRLSFRTGSLLILLGLIALWIPLGRFTLKNDHLPIEEAKDQSLRRILREHGREIQAAIQSNWEWFAEYLTKLRKSSTSGSSPLGHADDDDEDAHSSVNTTEHLVQSGAFREPAHAKSLRKSKLELSNLGNMDMPTHKVHGKVQPCLQLLPEAELQTLRLPPAKQDEIARLRYYHLDEDAIEIEEEAGFQQGQQGRTRKLDLFAGKQTMGERADSYQVKDSMEVHCGFAGKDTGFDISVRDQKYLKRCKVAVVTASFGGGDMLAQPIGMTNRSLSRVCYVAFWDDATLKGQEANGVLPDKTGKVGRWRIIVVSNLPFVDQRRNGKIPKVLTHRLLPNTRFSIWVDSKYQFRRDPLGVLEALLWRKKKDFAISKHGARKCVYAEGEAVVRKHKARPEEVAVQLNQYRAEGLPVNATFQGQPVLAEASIIIREHNSVTNLFMCLWFNEMVRFTARDQLSFGYVVRRLNLLKPHLFPVCTRRALVNVLGHERKAKPLVPETVGNKTSS